MTLIPRPCLLQPSQWKPLASLSSSMSPDPGSFARASLGSSVPFKVDSFHVKVESPGKRLQPRRETFCPGMEVSLLWYLLEASCKHMVGGGGVKDAKLILSFFQGTQLNYTSLPPCSEHARVMKSLSRSAMGSSCKTSREKAFLPRAFLSFYQLGSWNLRPPSFGVQMTTVSRKEPGSLNDQAEQTCPTHLPGTVQERGLNTCVLKATDIGVS